jgi:hypothetical protein
MAARDRKSIAALRIASLILLAPLAFATTATAQVGLKAQVDALQTQVSTLQDQVSALQAAVAALQVPAGPFSAASLSGSYVFHFSGITVDATVRAYNLFTMTDIGFILNLGCTQIDDFGSETCISDIFTGRQFGELVYPFPVVAHQFGAGTLVADGAGNLTGSGICHLARPVNTVRANLAPQLGGVATPPQYGVAEIDQTISVTGTYTVNADGSGSMTLTTTPACGGGTGSATLSFVLGSGGRLGTFWEMDATHGGGVSGTFARQ